MSDPEETNWPARLHPDARHHAYLGDGVYVCHDGWHVWLMTPRESGIHEIALDPGLLRNLREYVQRVNAEEFRDQVTREKDEDRGR